MLQRLRMAYYGRIVPSKVIASVSGNILFCGVHQTSEPQEDEPHLASFHLVAAAYDAERQRVISSWQPRHRYDTISVRRHHSRLRFFVRTTRNVPQPCFRRRYRHKRSLRGILRDIAGALWCLLGGILTGLSCIQRQWPPLRTSHHAKFKRREICSTGIVAPLPHQCTEEAGRKKPLLSQDVDPFGDSITIPDRDHDAVLSPRKTNKTRTN